MENQFDLDEGVFGVHEHALKLPRHANRAIIALAHAQLLVKFEHNSKNLESFLQLVKAKLSHYNQAIPGTGKGILRFDEKPPQGMAFALIAAMNDNNGDFVKFVNQRGQINVYLASLALSNEDDNIGGISNVLAAIGNIIQSKNSTQSKKNASNERPNGRSPLMEFLRQYISSNKYTTTTTDEIYDSCVNGQSLGFKLRGDEEAEITISETGNPTKKTHRKITWVANFIGGYICSEKPISWRQFQKICSDIRGEI